MLFLFSTFIFFFGTDHFFILDFIYLLFSFTPFKNIFSYCLVFTVCIFGLSQSILTCYYTVPLHCVRIFQHCTSASTTHSLCSICHIFYLYVCSQTVFMSPERVLSCVQLYNPMNCRLRGSFVHEFPGKNIGVGCHSLLQEIFLTSGGLKPCLLCLLHWQLDSVCLSHLGSPLFFLQVANYLFIFISNFPISCDFYFFVLIQIFIVYLLLILSEVVLVVQVCWQWILLIFACQKKFISLSFLKAFFTR